MQLRRFTADSTPAALAAVREALGDHAIILANRRVGEQVEIIATGQMDESSTLAEVDVNELSFGGGRSSYPKSVAGSSGANKQTEADLQSARSGGVKETQTTTIEDLTTHLKKRNETVQSVKPVDWTDRVLMDSTSSSLLESQNSVEKRQTDNTPTGQSQSDASDTRINEQRSANTSNRGIQPVFGSIDDQAVADGALEATGIDRLIETLNTQTALINGHFKSLTVNLWGANSPNRSLHLQRLISLGIGAELAVRLVERTDPEQSVDQAMRESLSLLKSTLPIGVDKTLTQPGVTITSGPPGSGKTTVLIKLAAQHVTEHGGDSIVLICADTRRIGAFEELQAYGRILGVPTVHAHDTGELDSLLSAFTHKHLVLIDHTLPNEDDTIALPSRLARAANPDVVRQLFVLSAGMQSSLADSLIENHGNTAGMQCVLTHLDTASRLGELFNPVIRHHLPIAYWSDSASVQQPLQRADASVLVASAVAMRKRIEQSSDDKWLHRLIQPTQPLTSGAAFSLDNPNQRSR